METALTIGIGGVAIYLVVGVCLLVPIHRRALTLIDPACASSSVFFRALVSPGLITFWPLILMRWRRATRSESTAGPLERPLSPEGLRNTHAIAVMTLAVAGPIVMMLALSLRGEPPVDNNFPNPTHQEISELQRGPSLGRIFPAIAADVYLAHHVPQDVGLLFDYYDASTTQPVALYWAKAWDRGMVMPHDAVFLGIVSGPQDTWIPFADPSMTTEGHWIAYSFLTHETAHFAVSAEKRRGPSL